MRIYVLEMYLKLMANDCGYWKAMAEYMMLLMETKILVWSFQ